ncbi:MAG: Gfo/Idh/MocA family oxidoreductase [Kiritimatiellae bacterium]|nr:Gfo/Idh/MocA family oxidoreductase [Kiritimatiellia bacterium]
MRIDFKGKLVDEPEIRAGFIGCGSHAFRNLYPTFQFAPVHLVATCDLQLEKAQAFAAKFGARHAYADYREMIEQETLDAVFVCTPYNAQGRPLYPEIAVECLNRGCHVWIEKPPAASCAEIERMQAASNRNGKIVLCGMKKMFFTANEKAKDLMDREAFGPPQLVMVQYPQGIPTQEQFEAYLGGKRVPDTTGFLDHLCHPMSLLVFLLGMPETLFFHRAPNGAGMATFTYAIGTVASLAFTKGASGNGGMERTTIIGKGRIVVDNGVRVLYHRGPAQGQGYGSTPSFFTGPPESASAMWEPEFSLGQLYNKGLFLLGYFGEVNEFARAILEKRPPAKGTLEQAWQVTRVFEAFAEGPGKTIRL